MSRHRNENTGFIFQFHHLLPEFSALENVMMPGLIQGMDRDELTTKARNLLDQVNLSHREEHRSGELSGGEQQRVSIARALANHPKIIYADEPTGSLDSKTSRTIIQLFDRIRRDFNTTIIIVTHNHTIAKHCDRTVKIKDGRIK